MDGERGWQALGLKPSKEGWLSEDPELIDRLVKHGSLGSGALAFWLSRDVRALKVWALWGAAALALAFGALRRDLSILVLGTALAGFYLFSLRTLVSTWSNGRLITRIAYALEPHPMPGRVAALLVGDPTRVAMKKDVAQAALMQFGRFEVLFFEEKNPRAFALEVAFRPLQVSAAPTDAPRS